MLNLAFFATFCGNRHLYIKPHGMKLHYLFFLCFIGYSIYGISQESEETPIFKNQISNNTSYLILGTLNLNYERIFGNHFALGIGGSTYGNAHKRAGFETRSSYEYVTNYEITPYGRVYFNGAQRKSHFLELFASFNESEEFDQFVRTTNEEGYGVYTKSSLFDNKVGLGIGYGYRFLLCKNRLLLEAQFGLRTNFDAFFIFPDGAVVRTGIRVGYRF